MKSIFLKFFIGASILLESGLSGTCEMKYEYTPSTRLYNTYDIPINGAIQSGSINRPYQNWQGIPWTGLGKANELTIYSFTKTMKIQFTNTSNYGTYYQIGCSNHSSGSMKLKRSSGVYDYFSDILYVNPGDKIVAWTDEAIDCGNIGFWIANSWTEVHDTMVYYTHSCPSVSSSSQGFNWEINDAGGNCYLETNNKYCSSSLPIGWDGIRSKEKNCRRQYQECAINCESPTVLDPISGKCIMSYETDCLSKGMVYNPTLNICEKENQCGNDDAFKNTDSLKCTMYPNCSVIDGTCNESAIKSCEDPISQYSSALNKCTKPINCNSSQILLENGNCGSLAYCTDGDTQETTQCKNFLDVAKSCSPYSRSSNLCYIGDNGSNSFDTTTYEDLIKVSLSGNFKESESTVVRPIFCSSDDTNCTFRLTDMYSSADGKSLCFKDNLSNSGCIKITGDCILNGKIEEPTGIKQLLIENSGKSIVAYNKEKQDNNLGSITTSCTVSGKVGELDNNRGDIIAATSNGIEIRFWDSYKRGEIGVISFLPTIKDEDINNGFEYADQDVMKLFRDNFTGFVKRGNATYAVYNGLISRNDCLTKVNGTSFFIGQAENDDEIKIYQSMSLLKDGNYNYNNGVTSTGSCVIKSTSAQSFNTQDYAVKKVNTANTSSKYVCSSLSCDEHTCQYNQCQNGYIGTVVEQTNIEEFLSTNYPNLSQSELCLEQSCDSKKPYYAYCGNNNGCPSDSNVFQLDDTRCAQAVCADGTLNPETGKCMKLECPSGTIKRNNKCYKSFAQ